MRNTLVPVLLLATVALSTSNILPFQSMREEPGPQGYGQSNDNIFSNKQRIRDEVSNVFFKIDIEKQKPFNTQNVYQTEVLNADNNAAEEYNTGQDDNYEVKGFRKEQWHNYPRQLDRPNKYFYENINSDKRNLDPDEPDEYSDINDNTERSIDKKSNEIKVNDIFDFQKPVEEADKAVALMNPLIVLKVYLACLRVNKDVDYSRLPGGISSIDINQLKRKENVEFNLNDDNPKSKLVKVKREGQTRLGKANSAQTEPKNRMMKKRIFSLWSRLQSLNHKGHELHHRRHLYALYGLPDSEGGGSGGVLTAETRATFMRPPGSPLRWG